jgi:hypothetical protein
MGIMLCFLPPSAPHAGHASTRFQGIWALLRSRRQSTQNRHRSDSHQAKLFGWIEDWIRKNHADKIA